MFYYRMNVYIVQVLSSCERVIKVAKKCENFWENFFFFDAYYLDLKILFDAYSLSTPLPPSHK